MAKRTTNREVEKIDGDINVEVEVNGGGDSSTSGIEGQFSLIPSGKPAVALVKISKSETIIFNRYTEQVNCAPFGNVPVATQEQLKKVYDAGKQYVGWVSPPTNYKAPWEN